MTKFTSTATATFPSRMYAVEGGFREGIERLEHPPQETLFAASLWSCQTGWAWRWLPGGPYGWRGD